MNGQSASGGMKEPNSGTLMSKKVINIEKCVSKRRRRRRERRRIAISRLVGCIDSPLIFSSKVLQGSCREDGCLGMQNSLDGGEKEKSNPTRLASYHRRESQTGSGNHRLFVTSFEQYG